MIGATFASDGFASLPNYVVPAGSIDLPISMFIDIDKIQWMIWTSDNPVRLRCNGVNATFTITESGTLTAGSQTVTYGGQTTAAIPFNSTAATYQAALQAISSIGPNNVVCSGGPFPAVPITITFTNTLGGQAITAPTKTDSYTGGTTVVAAGTTGVASTNVFNPGPSASVPWNGSDGVYTCPVSADVNIFYVTNVTTNAAKLNLLTAVNV